MRGVTRAVRVVYPWRHVRSRGRTEGKVCRSEESESHLVADESTERHLEGKESILIGHRQFVAELFQLIKEIVGSHVAAYDVGVGPVDTDTNLLPSWRTTGSCGWSFNDFWWVPSISTR